MRNLTIRVIDDKAPAGLTADDVRTYRQKIRSGAYDMPLVRDALAKLLNESGDV